MSECRQCGESTDRDSVAEQPLCWDCADHGPVADPDVELTDQSKRSLSGS